MNRQNRELNPGAFVFATITVIIHALFFVAESILWLKPYIYQNILSSANSTISLFEQAKLLEIVFFNQGFYNLFLALGLVAGMISIKRGYFERGITLLGFCCLFAVGAGLVLALSAGALLGAALQSGPPMIALILLYRNKWNNFTAVP